MKNGVLTMKITSNLLITISIIIGMGIACGGTDVAPPQDPTTDTTQTTTSISEIDTQPLPYMQAMHQAAELLFRQATELDALLMKNPTIRIGVGSFSGTDQEPHPLGEVIASLLPVQIKAIKPTIKIFTRRKIQQLLQELELNQTDFFSDEGRQRIGNFLGADVLILGTIMKAQSYYMVTLTAVDVETTEVYSNAQIQIAIDEDVRALIHDTVSTNTDFSEMVISDFVESGSEGEQFIQTGDLLFDQGRVNLALEQYKQAIQEGVETAALYFKMGYAYQTVFNKLDEALSYYNLALGLDDNIVLAYNNRGTVQYTMGNFADALADFNRAIRLDSDNAELYYNRGNVYDEMGNVEKAEADFIQALDLDPSHDSAYNNLGILYFRQESYELALAQYNQAIALNPEESYYYLNRGQTYYSLEQLDQAIADFNRAVRLDETVYEAYFYRGMCYLDQGKILEAKADFQQALQLEPAFAPAQQKLDELLLFVEP